MSLCNKMTHIELKSIYLTEITSKMFQTCCQFAEKWHYQKQTLFNPSTFGWDNKQNGNKRNKDGERLRNGTVLSRKIEELENAGKAYSIKWSIVDKAYPLKAGAKSCDLCSSEKMHIALGSKGFHKWPPGCIMLNKRKEILNKCVHKRSFALAQA